MTIALADDAATAALGARLASILRPGDIVLLEGGLGAGKTVLARAAIRALAGDPDLEIPSPTFALVQPYETATGPVLHADLYRLAGAREADELGLLDRPEAIVFIEWPERSPDLLRRATIVVRLDLPPGGNGRLADISVADGRTLSGF